MPRKPNEFLSPNSLRAKRDDLRAEVACVALAPGPPEAGFIGAPVVRGANRGDHETRYLELWSPRRVVLTSGVHLALIKVGSRSSVGAGVRTAQTCDHAPTWVSRLGAAAWNRGARGLARVSKGRPRLVLPLPRLRGLKGSFRPPRGLRLVDVPVKGRLKTPPLATL